VFNNSTTPTKLILPDTVTSLGADSFGQALTDITFSKNLTYLYTAFSKCTSLTNVYYKGSLEDWSKVTVLSTSGYPFYSSTKNTHFYMLENNEWKELIEVNIPNTVTNITQKFYNFNSITKVTIPSSLTDLGSNAFSKCKSLNQVELSDGIIDLGFATFSDCSSLTNITIPSSVTTIDGYTLQIGSSSNKATIIMRGTTPPTIASNTFKTSNLNKIIVPVGCADVYKSATNWSSLASYIYEEE
jgi:hypothetical protein